jgi:hypothetical protein
MKRIVHLSLESAASNSTREVTVLGETFQIVRLGTDQNSSLLEDLVREYDGKVDCIAISGFPTPITLDGQEHTHATLKKIQSIAVHSPCVDGHHLRDLLGNWSLRSQIRKDGEFLKDRKIGFFCGTVQKNMLEAYRDTGAKLLFADPYFLLRAPILIKGEKALHFFLSRAIHALTKRPMSLFRKREFKEADFYRNALLRDFLSCDAYVFNSSQLSYFSADFLSGKVTDFGHGHSGTKSRPPCPGRSENHLLHTRLRRPRAGLRVHPN